jgi:hypothetical protein
MYVMHSMLNSQFDVHGPSGEQKRVGARTRLRTVEDERKQRGASRALPHDPPQTCVICPGPHLYSGPTGQGCNINNSLSSHYV